MGIGIAKKTLFCFFSCSKYLATARQILRNWGCKLNTGQASKIGSVNGVIHY